MQVLFIYVLSHWHYKLETCNWGTAEVFQSPLSANAWLIVHGNEETWCVIGKLLTCYLAFLVCVSESVSIWIFFNRRRRDSMTGSQCSMEINVTLKWTLEAVLLFEEVRKDDLWCQRENVVALLYVSFQKRTVVCNLLIKILLVRWGITPQGQDNCFHLPVFDQQECVTLPS